MLTLDPVAAPPIADAADVVADTPVAPVAPPRAPLIFLAKYRPLIASENGQRAIKDYSVPPYVDAACRREPDFENPFPGISGLAFADKFAPKLRAGDVVIYVTQKGKYDGFPVLHWRVVAALKVEAHFESHEAAAAWYREHNRALPSNIVVDGNEPVAMERTCQMHADDAGKEHPVRSLDEWDTRFQERVADYGAFAATRPLYVELNRPPRITETDAKAIFLGREMSSRAPVVLSRDTVDRLIHTCWLQGLDASEFPAAATS